jgi:hypothetical protein
MWWIGGVLILETSVEKNLVQERIASLKVGIVSGLTTGLLWLGLFWVRFALLPEQTSLPTPLQGLLSVAIAGVSGFLFGITYRHMIRQEQDDHLQAGTVGAFGLVRGLAQLNISHFDLRECLMAGMTLAESLVLFGVARIVLNACFDRGWIQRFPIQPPSV